jgi:Zn-dependent protease with chaperone function
MDLECTKYPKSPTQETLTAFGPSGIRAAATIHDPSKVQESPVRFANVSYLRGSWKAPNGTGRATSSRMRRKFLPLLITSLVGLSALVACSSESEVDEAESAHKAGEPVLVNNPHVWVETEYSPVAEQLSNWGMGAPTLDDKDPLSVRLQFWLDRMHGAVGDLVAAKGNPLTAPRPLIKILKDEATINAWVMSVNTCTGIELQGTAPAPGSFGIDAGAMEAGAPGLDAGIAVAPSLSLLQLSSMTYAASCADPRVAWNKNAFAAYWNGQGGTCGLRVSGDKITATENCAPKNTTKLAAASTSNYIHFTSGLLRNLDEVAMATVLAHELGHYYRGHVLESTKARARFWYEDGGEERPMESARAKDLEERYKKLEHAEHSLSSGGLVLKGKYSPRLRGLLVNSVGPILKRIPGSFGCSIARDTLGPWAASVVNQFPSLEAQRAYLRYESEVFACASSLKFSLEGVGAGQAPSPNDGGSDAGIGPTANLHTLLVSLQHTAMSEYGLLSLPSTLGELLYGADQFARKQETEEEAFLTLLRENKIGLYTTEQEADDISLELMTNLGYTSDEVVEAWIRIGYEFDRVRREAGSGAWESYIRESKYDVKQCENLLRQDFKNFGRSVFVPIGDLHGNHHGNCYRIFNIHRESKKHLYKPGPKQSLPTPAWSELVSKL